MPIPDPSVRMVPGVGVGGGGAGGPGVLMGNAAGAPDFAPTPWTSETGAVRLASNLAFGPTIRHDDSFATTWRA